MHSTTSQPNPGPWSALQRIIRRRLPWWMGACTLGLLTPLLTQAMSTGPVGHLMWLLDLVAHWQWLFVGGLALGMPMALFAMPRCLFFALLLPLPWWTAAPAVRLSQGDTTLTVASANVHVSTAQLGPLADWLTLVKPDVVVLLEVSRALGPQLVSLQQYPHQIVHADDSPFGVAVLSKWPLQASVVRQDSDGVAHIQTEVIWDQQRIHLLAFHPMPPLSPHFHAARNEAIRRFTSQLQTENRPALLAGDLNATPWSSAFAGLDALGWRRTTSLRPTWPSWGHGVVGIPIDHVLASEHWRVAQSGLGPDLGSDHRPVVVRLVRMPDAHPPSLLTSPQARPAANAQ